MTTKQQTDVIYNTIWLANNTDTDHARDNDKHIDLHN